MENNEAELSCIVLYLYSFIRQFMKMLNECTITWQNKHTIYTAGAELKLEINQNMWKP